MEINIPKIILFHGGCHDCTRQIEDGIDFCRKCQYFDADWDLPNYNNRPMCEAELMRKRIKNKYKMS